MIFVLPIVAVSALVAAIALARIIIIGIQAKRWPKETAIVVQSTVTQRWTKYGDHYYVRVSYAYDGNRSGECVLPSFLGTGSEGYARRLAEFFREDATVPIYIHPLKRDRSVLLPGFQHRDLALLVLMIASSAGSSTALFYL